MNIAYTLAPHRGDTDLFLYGQAHRLIAAGYRVRGTVQCNTDRSDGGPCDMDVRVLPDGPTFRISQSLGQGSRGCRLDPAALESAVGLVEASMATGYDILIVNKFGKHEAEGGGFRSLIGVAACQDMPVLVGVNALNEAAFHDFTGGLAAKLPLAYAAVDDWLARNRLMENA